MGKITGSDGKQLYYIGECRDGSVLLGMRNQAVIGYYQEGRIFEGTCRKGAIPVGYYREGKIYRYQNSFDNSIVIGKYSKKKVWDFQANQLRAVGYYEEDVDAAALLLLSPHFAKLIRRQLEKEALPNTLSGNSNAIGNNAGKGAGTSGLKNSDADVPTSEYWEKENDTSDRVAGSEVSKPVSDDSNDESISDDLQQEPETDTYEAAGYSAAHNSPVSDFPRSARPRFFWGIFFDVRPKVLLVILTVLAFALCAVVRAFQTFVLYNNNTITSILQYGLPLVAFFVISIHFFLKKADLLGLTEGATTGLILAFMFWFGLSCTGDVSEFLFAQIMTIQSGFIACILLIMLPFMLLCMVFTLFPLLAVLYRSITHAFSEGAQYYMNMDDNVIIFQVICRFSALVYAVFLIMLNSEEISAGGLLIILLTYIISSLFASKIMIRQGIKLLYRE